jgi:hypothetical protein
MGRKVKYNYEFKRNKKEISKKPINNNRTQFIIKTVLIIALDLTLKSTYLDFYDIQKYKTVTINFKSNKIQNSNKLMTTVPIRAIPTLSKRLMFFCAK